MQPPQDLGWIQQGFWPSRIPWPTLTYDYAKPDHKKEDAGQTNPTKAAIRAYLKEAAGAAVADKASRKFCPVCAMPGVHSVLTAVESSMVGVFCAPATGSC